MAGRFRFSLEVVRRLRRLARDERRRVLAESVRAVQSAESFVDDLQRSLRESLTFAAAQEEMDRLDISTLRAEQLHRAWLHEQIRLADERVVTRRGELGEQRARLAAANKQWRVIENLRERSWARHQQQIRREEQAVDDEAGTVMFSRRNFATLSGADSAETKR